MEQRNSKKWGIGLLLAALAAGCEQPAPVDAEKASLKADQTLAADEQPTTEEATQQQTEPGYKTVDWTVLIPEAELDALLNPPEYLNEVEDGSVEDQINGQLQTVMAPDKNDRYQQALVSTTVIPEMDGQLIRIPGYIVPLEFSEERHITEFFLVPFFGACIHVPPPPPNQIIYVRYPAGLALTELYDAYWISGKLETTLVENDTATSAYSMEMAEYELYTE